jgi:hypothetical protein
MKTKPTANPLIQGFKLGLLLPTADELEGHNLTPRTKCRAMHAKPSIPDLAARWRCNPRTVYRMIAAGVDATDPIAVAQYLAELRAPKADMIEAVLQALETLESP